MNCSSYNSNSYARDSCERDWPGVTGRRKRKKAIMNAVQSQIDALSSRVSSNEVNVDALSSRVSSNEANVDALSSRVSSNEADIDSIESSILALQNALNNLDFDSVGDIKYSLMSVDHDGWFKMDGLSYQSHGLSLSQIGSANDLGFGGFLPNLTDSYLSQGGQIGTFSRSNSISLNRSHLPNVVLSASSGEAGAHSHTVRHGATGGDNYALVDGGGGHFVGDGSGVVNGVGNHTHTVTVESLNSGVQNSIDKRPYTFSANSFVYLGN